MYMCVCIKYKLIPLAKYRYQYALKCFASLVLYDNTHDFNIFCKTRVFWQIWGAKCDRRSGIYIILLRYSEFFHSTATEGNSKRV